MQLYKKYGKRLMDFFLAAVALILFSPLLLVIAVLVRINLGSPVLFKQERPGYKEKIFTLYKFRTMTDARDAKGQLLPNKRRLTKFGRFLRSTSLDELPELLNIIKGDMAIIGPRPLAVEYLPYYTNEERARHSIRPGLSGLAQINGRNTASWEQRFQYDLEYITNITLANDIKIMIKTLKKVIERTDVGELGVDTPIDFDQYRKAKQKATSG
ncbi:sugar transferase [Lysinibacillus odysseyi]|uniref:Bacterial sugar transferase domain-containing protein n=1 Tax=Lysinibacillus odysseyi 34hs-1 = NBRC 100172 TaxID=1220589 RepID=A0A0A3IP49_9BACI|nr:sugar transferase [Lysinibacillus odysseyi]KGR86501.1 hypothetical protein CD32_06315 [Lysinibacillus odysseyi 34hs-1 = NBRC 100172]